MTMWSLCRATLLLTWATFAGILVLNDMLEIVKLKIYATYAVFLYSNCYYYEWLKVLDQELTSFQAEKCCHLVSS